MRVRLRTARSCWRFRDALSGDGGLDWESSDPISGWDGAEVDPATGRITRLDLDGERQAGVGALRAGRTDPAANTGFLKGPADRRDTGNVEQPEGAGVPQSWPTINWTGGIPGELARLTELQALRLQGNLLTGQIPAELAGAIQSCGAEARAEPADGVRPGGAAGCGGQRPGPTWGCRPADQRWS